MRHRRSLFGLVLLAVGLASASACSNQHEGERCDKLNGNDDCESGLVCTTYTGYTTSSGTGGQNQGGVLPAVCCPPQGQRATAEICTANAITPIEPSDAGSGGAAGDGGPGGAAGSAGAAGGGGEAGEGGTAGTAGAGGSSGAMDTGGTMSLDASSD